MKLLVFAVLLAVVAICQAKPSCDNPLQELINNYTTVHLNKDKSGSSYSFLQVFAPIIHIGENISEHSKTVQTSECNCETSKNHTIEWMPATRTTAAKYAERALVVGYDYEAKSALWAARAVPTQGVLIPGKFAISFMTSDAYIPFNGKEVEIKNFEILLAHPSTFQWIYSNGGQFPDNAFPAGHSETGEVLYICRAIYKNSITNGKLHPSRQHCYIGWGYVEHPYAEYEVLCRI